MTYHSLNDVYEDFEMLDRDERWGLIIDLGRALEPMPDATSTSDRLHFLADSTSGITKGIIALILLAVQDRNAKDVLATDIEAALRPFNLEKHFSSKRTQGIPNMIALIRQTADRLAG